ncbi:exodeoxyribonuclease I [Lysobacter capsici]|uniref:exodeoxyribonuclease I n=1 Tax=Lysobacter capsici TaxID=435897 RepID=UPI00287BC137|nr:exodeoxyribonuclease I [Lysobacter capsici]WND78211.1 exodeoxyribonuclease I [Lysobacter capsici]WND83405.1 exodeoxyribonuclease I [Lysobacter capsici]
MPASFLFYDLETYGSDPRTTRIAQFAAIRTDADLNQIDTPISVFVKPADDLLPSPIATVITGIAPQDALRDGVSEAEIFALIFDEMARPETCSAGYNSLRFDDEFVRYGLFRNFYDPYEREWRGGNSRWDLLDVLRLAHALRPDGIVWPRREDGATSFKLEHLAEANGVREGDAHEALSDVRALIGIARKFKAAQPKLWEYALRLRDKRFAGSLLDVIAMTPALHVSQRYPAARMCAAPVIPLARHPRIDNRVLVFDLAQDPAALLRLAPDEIADRLYTPTADLPQGEERIALKEVHLNRCPALIAWNHLRPADFERLKIDPAQVERHAAQIREAGPELVEKVRRVYANDRARDPSDVDASLYDAFIGDGDKRLFRNVRTTAPEALAQAAFEFRDARLPELLFRYRARNWPQTLSVAERERWDAYRRHRLVDDSGLSEFNFERFAIELQQARAMVGEDGAKQALLDRLEDWAGAIERDLNASG